MPTIVLKLLAGQVTGWTDRRSGDYMLYPLGSIKTRLETVDSLADKSSIVGKRHNLCNGDRKPLIHRLYSPVGVIFGHLETCLTRYFFLL